MISDTDRVYNEHCSRCHLRHSPNCFYANCSFDQYQQWLKEAHDQMISEQKELKSREG